MSHLAPATLIETPVDLERPFSNFRYIEERFSASHPIHKLFSISRCHGGKTLLIETVPAVGNVALENEDLALLDGGFEHLELVRLSFWKIKFSGSPPDTLKDGDCIGYALLKKDQLTLKEKGDRAPCKKSKWHVYEAVFRSYPHLHTYAKAQADFKFNAAGRVFSIRGCLYAQQNGVNKTCAQVAIRSIAATYHGANDLSYRRINDLAANGNSGFNPAKGMNDGEVSRVLDGLDIEHRSVMLEKLRDDEDQSIQGTYSCEKLLYAGVESGAGSLMSFKPTNQDNGRGDLHMIPFFGHTFNEDSWVPNAEKNYFQLSGELLYQSSIAWLSHFLVHDDNFGANLCVPRKFIRKNDISCVFELRPKGFKYSGVDAELDSASLLYSVLNWLEKNASGGLSKEPWLRRLRNYANDTGRLVLRHVPVSRERYVGSLKTNRGWNHEREKTGVVREIGNYLKAGNYWMMEISVPEVFPTNKRKLGEILLDATRPQDLESGVNFIMIRIPGAYVFPVKYSVSKGEFADFILSPSNIRSHTPLLTG